jgi:hypothetical protein
MSSMNRVVKAVCGLHNIAFDALVGISSSNNSFDK